jgi:hypothetical protein
VHNTRRESRFNSYPGHLFCALLGIVVIVSRHEVRLVVIGWSATVLHKEQHTFGSTSIYRIDVFLASCVGHSPCLLYHAPGHAGIKPYANLGSISSSLNSHEIIPAVCKLSSERLLSGRRIDGKYGTHRACATICYSHRLVT